VPASAPPPERGIVDHRRVRGGPAWRWAGPGREPLPAWVRCGAQRHNRPGGDGGHGWMSCHGTLRHRRGSRPACPVCRSRHHGLARTDRQGRAAEQNKSERAASPDRGVHGKWRHAAQGMIAPVPDPGGTALLGDGAAAGAAGGSGAATSGAGAAATGTGLGATEGSAAAGRLLIATGA